MSDDRALALLPPTLRHRPGLRLVLHRGSRQLIVLEHRPARTGAARSSVSVATPGAGRRVPTFTSKWNRSAFCIAWSIRVLSSCNRWSSGRAGRRLSSIPTDFDGGFRR